MQVGEPAFVDELAVILAWAFDYLQRDGDPKDSSWLREAHGGSVYLRLSTRALDQPARTMTEPLREAIIAGGYWLKPPGPGAELAIVVDAMRTRPIHPGRVHRLTVPHSGGERARAARSHGIDLGQAVELARELDRLPERLVLYAVEAADVGDGVGLTMAVRDAAERLADEIAVVARAARQARALPI